MRPIQSHLNTISNPLPMSSAAMLHNSSANNALYYDQIGRISQTEALKWDKTGLNGSIKGLNGWQCQSGSAAALRLPLLQEVHDIFGTDASGGFEFSLFLAHNEFAVGIENGQAWDPFFQR